MIPLHRFAKILLLLVLCGCAHSARQVIELHYPTTDLYRAAGKGDLEALAKANDTQIKNANEIGTTLLMVAARRNRLNSVDYLLGRGAIANSLDMHKQSVLHYALPVRNPLINAALINAGADPSVEDQFGVVPAVVWAEQGSFDSLLLGLQSKEKWCCLAQIKEEVHKILDAASKQKKYIPPAIFLVLKELE
jgi:ankyrin repeat protein